MASLAVRPTIQNAFVNGTASWNPNFFGPILPGERLQSVSYSFQGRQEVDFDNLDEHVSFRLDSYPVRPVSALSDIVGVDGFSFMINGPVTAPMNAGMIHFDSVAGNLVAWPVFTGTIPINIQGNDTHRFFTLSFKAASVYGLLIGNVIWNMNWRRVSQSAERRAASSS